ncbi:MAG: Xaa-Pro peptidase family protein [Woeseiaceae bacterium]|nr:Xaa-Pro peptidase family protein [Woeseiaceae bacterium]
MEILANLSRAREIMAAEDIDGIVAALPINVYYLSGYWGLLMGAERFDAAFFAVLPAHPETPAALVLPSMELRRLVTEGGTWMPEVFIYTSPDGEFDQIAVNGMPYGGWPVRKGSALTDLEDKWIDATQAQVGRVSGNAMGALTRAIEASRLDSGRLVTDDSRVAEWLRRAGLDKVRCRTDAGVLNRIRAVKTPAELALMRTAARINEVAMREAASVFREGAHWSDIENAYNGAMATAGGVGTYVICGAGGPPTGRIRRDEPMFLDALGTYRQYHGDIGRCVVLGEPSDLMRQRHAALCAGWEAVQPLLKPGTRYSELADTAVDAVRRSGLPEFVYATPHALGLEHTDDPKPAGSQQGMTSDIVLEKGMVLNIDMPFTEIGWGSVHIEDTVHILDDGFESLTGSDLSIIEI